MSEHNAENIDFRNIKQILYNSVKLYGNNIAFSIKHQNDNNVYYENKTYREFLEDINSFGASLYYMGLKGAKIAIIGRNRYEWALAYLTNLLGGMISVPLDRELQLMELEESLIRSGVKGLIFDGKYKELIDEVKKRNKTQIEFYICMDYDRNFISMKKLIENDKNKQVFIQEFINCNIDSKSMSVLLFTSGTTSKSKVVMLNQEGIAVNIQDMLKVEGFKATDVNIAFLPFHHIFGSTGLLVMLASGIKNVFADGLRHIKHNMQEYKVSVFVGVPLLIDKMYQGIEKEIKRQGKEKLVKFGRKISKFMMRFNIDIRRRIFKDILDQLGGNLRLIISGGAPLEKSLAENFKEYGIDVVQGYGLTETSPVISAEDIRHRKTGSVGVPMENTKVEIVNKDENGIGEIRVKGPNVMLGYYENQEVTNEVLEDGWFYTGDLAFIDPEGYIFITGRKKDVIVLKNGKKAFPDELEILVNKIPGVEESFVYGKPENNDINDLVVSAKVVYNKDNIRDEYGEVSEKELFEIIWNKIKEINKTLPRYKYIKNLILTNTPLIKTSTNKIKRNEELKLVLEN